MAKGKRVLFFAMGVEYTFTLHASFEDVYGVVAELGKLENSKGGSCFAVLLDGQVKFEQESYTEANRVFQALKDN